MFLYKLQYFVLNLLFYKIDLATDSAVKKTQLFTDFQYFTKSKCQKKLGMKCTPFPHLVFITNLLDKFHDRPVCVWTSEFVPTSWMTDGLVSTLTISGELYGCFAKQESRVLLGEEFGCFHEDVQMLTHMGAYPNSP